MNDFTCLYYWLIEPIRAVFKDTADSLPAFEIPVRTLHETCQFALFLDEQGLPLYARLSIPGHENEKLDEEKLPLIQAVREHLVSILRLTFHPEAQLFPIPIWAFVSDTTSYSIGVELSKVTVENFDADRVRRLFVGSFPHRIEVRLLSDGLNKRIPLQFRYLSLFKIIEIHYRERKIWRESELKSFLSKYEPAFRKLGIMKQPYAYLQELRDKCAHIKTGRQKDEIGVTSLDHQQAADVASIMPIMLDICTEVLNERADGDYVIQKLTQQGDLIS